MPNDEDRIPSVNEPDEVSPEVRALMAEGRQRREQIRVAWLNGEDDWVQLERTLRARQPAQVEIVDEPQAEAAPEPPPVVETIEGAAADADAGEDPLDDEEESEDWPQPLGRRVKGWLVGASAAGVLMFAGIVVAVASTPAQPPTVTVTTTPASSPPPATTTNVQPASSVGGHTSQTAPVIKTSTPPASSQSTTPAPTVTTTANTGATPPPAIKATPSTTPSQSESYAQQIAQAKAQAVQSQKAYDAAHGITYTQPALSTVSMCNPTQMYDTVTGKWLTVYHACPTDQSIPKLPK